MVTDMHAARGRPRQREEDFAETRQLARDFAMESDTCEDIFTSIRRKSEEASGDEVSAAIEGIAAGIVDRWDLIGAEEAACYTPCSLQWSTKF